jgi:mannose-1-phosphate guanylyltransferase/mannose-6-phosphate isomerase
VCGEEQRFLVAEQFREAGLTAGAIVLEPERRNSAPAAAVAALLALQADSAALILILPSDHVIRDVSCFHAAITAGVPAARNGALVAFGVTPTRPERGYGYIHQGKPLANAPGCFEVERFVEKPDPEAAKTMLAAKKWFWNSGIFLFAAEEYLEELDRHKPGIVKACRAAIAKGLHDLDFFRLDRAAFIQSPAESIDYAVMEHTRSAAVVPANIGWSDVGSWSMLYELGEHDAEGNVIVGDVIVDGVTNSYLRSEKQILAAIGVQDMLVVATEDSILVAPLNRSQDVRSIVERIKTHGKNQLKSVAKVYRPWGHYQMIDSGDRFQVKHLTVKPGARLSLQRHRRRAEHWVVVQGLARVTRGTEVFDLKPNESTYIPLGARHRLENPGTEPLCVIEIQSGDYLGEDDIIRFEDAYGRTIE